jgi:predicted DNA-binding transcriptional regulator YafY
MNRTAWLQDRRMQKFRDVLSRWEGKELSAMEAAEILEVSERQFRRYRRRYEASRGWSIGGWAGPRCGVCR